MKRIAVFCGSNTGNEKSYLDACEQLAGGFSRQNIGVVYGGGKVGLMGKLADEMLKLSGEVIGVIPAKLMDKELGHAGITELKIVDTMHARKALIAELSDAFIALPGGVGTLEEIIEMFTLTQLGYQAKPCALFNVSGYFDKLIAFLDEMVDKQFLKQKHRDLLIVEEDPELLILKLKENENVYVDKWD